MNVEKINELAAFLENVPAAVFEMESWTETAEVEGSSVTVADVPFETAQACGMTACLGGWAAVALPNDLELYLDGGFSDVRSVAADSDGDRACGPWAIAQALDICSACAMRLVDADALHQSPKEAATVLRNMAEGRQWYEGILDESMLADRSRRHSLRSLPECRFTRSGQRLQRCPLPGGAH